MVMPLGLSRYVDTGRFAAAVELDWLQHADVAGLAITAVPAIHFSKRGLRDRNASLWCGFHLQAGERSVLFTGDTAYGPVFKEVAPLLPAPDLALVPIGAYDPRPLMRGSHCTPEEGVRIGREWGAKRLCGMHWGTIRLTDEPPFEPPARFKAAAMEAGYGDLAAWTLAIGETRSIKGLEAAEGRHLFQPLPPAAPRLLGVDHVAAVNGVDVDLVAFGPVILVGLLNAHVDPLPLLELPAVLYDAEWHREQTAHPTVL